MTNATVILSRADDEGSLKECVISDLREFRTLELTQPSGLGGAMIWGAHAPSRAHCGASPQYSDREKSAMARAPSPASRSEPDWHYVPSPSGGKDRTFMPVVSASPAHKIIGATSVDFGPRHRVAQ
jgi:hypothetical protein